MIKVNDKKTAIVGSIVGLVILLTVFSCKGNEEAPADAVEATTAVEELKATIEELTPEVEEVLPATEEATPAETVE